MMKSEEHHKLVRDRIPDKITNNGEVVITHIAEAQEFEHALAQKLHEEVAEFLANPSAEEAADILEVLYTLCALNTIDIKNLEEARQAKADKWGGFEKRIILERTE